MAKKTIFIDMEPIGLRGEVPAGTSLLEAARQMGVGIVSLCAGEGWCEGCLVRVEKGEMMPPTMSEEAVISPEDFNQGIPFGMSGYPNKRCKDRDTHLILIYPSTITSGGEGARGSF